MPIQSEPYDVGYYDQHLRGSLLSAKTILGRLFEDYKPSSMLDVGCGIGTWLRASAELGVKNLQGIDGDHVERKSLLVDESIFRPIDLKGSFELNRSFDLTVSVEVAEHLPYDRGPSFVRDLTATSDVILFSAAAPYQGGRGHFNEQWPEYWAILFRAHGFDCFDLFRDSVWDNHGVEPWYAQNAFLFIRQDHPLQEKFAHYRSANRPLSRIHPHIYLINITRHRPITNQVLDAELSDWQRLADAFVAGAMEVPPLLAVLNFQTDKSPSDSFPWTRLRYSSSVELEEKYQSEIESLRDVEQAAPGEQPGRHLVAAMGRLAVASSAKINGLVDVLVSRDKQLANLEHRLTAAEAHFQAEKQEWQRQSQERLRLLSKALNRGTGGSLIERLRAMVPGRVNRWIDARRNEREAAEIRASGLFDADWYHRAYPDVATTGLDPIWHYVVHGTWEGRQPRPDFDTTKYLMEHESLLLSRRNPFAHFIRTQPAAALVQAPAPVSTGAEVRRLESSAAEIEQQVARLEPTGAFNTGWYGERRLAASERFHQMEPPPQQQVDIANQRYDAKTQLIWDIYYGPLPIQEPTAIVRFGPAAEIRAEIAGREPRSDVAASSTEPTYSIITSYYSHEDYFARCAASVAALFARDFATTGKRRIEWIVVDDDPSMSSEALTAMLPDEVKPFTQIFWMAADGVNRGVVAPLNEAIGRASNDWILFLDNDDMIAAETCAILDHYIRKFQRCRYIASAMVDIAEDDTVIRLRRHDHAPASILESGMIAGHLKAIRRDLFRELGLLKLQYAGVQDYEFALRVSIREPILLIPEYLYYYRWHKKSISVRRIEWQNRTADMARNAFIREFVDQRWPDTTGEKTAMPMRERGSICLVRTQGKRLELLMQAIESLLNQPIPVTPCIIVHGERTAHMVVKRWLAKYADRIVLLFADEPSRRRGYPLNVGLEYAAKNSDRFEYLFFLDDDDIMYPLFTERVQNAFSLTGADVVYAHGNRRESPSQLQLDVWPMPTASILFGNFIPINCFAVRVDSLIASGARFREDMDYLEDWDFLVSLLAAGLHFRLIHEVLSEFRIIGDGNTTIRRHPEHFEECRRRVWARSAMAAKQIGLGRFYRDLLDFDFSERPALSENDLYHLAQTHTMFRDADARPTV